MNKKEMVLTEGLEEFLIKGNLSDNTFWNNQGKFFFITCFFIAPQLFASNILPIVCSLIEIIILLFLKRNEKNPYANVYNGFCQMVIWIVIWWIDGCCMLSLVLQGAKLILICLSLTLLYVLCVIRYISFAKKVIQKNYKTHSISVKSIAGITAMITTFGAAIRVGMRNVRLDNEVAFIILAVLFFLLPFLLIFVADVGVSIYYYSQLSKEEQIRIANTDPNN